MVKIKVHYPSLSLQNHSSNSHRATGTATAGKSIRFPCHPSKAGTKPNAKINKNFESVGRNKKRALEPAKQTFEKAKSSYKVDSGETEVKNGLQNATAIEVKGLDDEVGSDHNPTDQGERERLVIRWKLTADGRAKIIKDSNLNGKPHANLEGDGDHEAKTQRDISFITGVLDLILKDMNKKGKSIFKKQDRKAVQETSRERFKICTPRWKPIGKPRISLGAPGLCSRSSVAYTKVL
ncbi:hypothetical protein Pint_20539 [Pistacia integerrima]|uniref:Uncharacterized protein n=1 Tax=Pistacia integerrima TaxID=434235 RepID=A0ACC0XE55_9ROSI|nr:hypothetical protein Pint_20539 [Pistacia integerrima]